MPSINLLPSKDQDQDRELIKKEKPEEKKQTWVRKMTKPIRVEKPTVPKIEKPSWWSSIFKKKEKTKKTKPEKKLEVKKTPVVEKKPEPVKPEPVKPEPVKPPFVEKKPEPVMKSKIQKTEKGVEVSLMEGKAIIIPRLIRSKFLFFIACLIVALTMSVIVWLYSDWHFEKIATEVKKTQIDIQLLEAQTMSYLNTRDQVAILEKKSSIVENVLNKHVYWTKFFTLLENYTIPSVSFGDFSANTSGTIRLNTMAPSLISIAKQYVSFSQAPDFIKSLDVSNIRTLPNGNVVAFFNLVLNDDVFYK